MKDSNGLNYFIKEEYKINPVQTFNINGVEEYWNDERIAANHSFQYHVYEFARTIFDQHRFKSVVDIGAGPATKMKLFFSDIGNNVTIIDQPTVEMVAKKIFADAVFRSANLEDASFSTGIKYDMVICSDVIEHLSEPDTLLEIIRSHVKYPSGVVVLSTPDRDLRWGKENYQSPNKQHVREWNAKEFRIYIEHSGFRVVEHIHLPLKKLHPVLFKLSRIPLVYKKYKKNSWYPNQTLLLRLK